MIEVYSNYGCGKLMVRPRPIYETAATIICGIRHFLCYVLMFNPRKKTSLCLLLLSYNKYIGYC